MRRPHEPQRATPPESCQNLSAAFDGARFVFYGRPRRGRKLARDTESGTGTAIHSSLGLMWEEYFRP